MQSERGNCTHTYMVMCMRGGGWRVDELVAKIRTVKISSEAFGGIFAKVCTSKNFQLYGMHGHYLGMDTIWEWTLSGIMVYVVTPT